MRPLLAIAELREKIRTVPDFPKPGILFKDITPILADRSAFHSLVEHLSQSVPPQTTVLAAVESRGFILGAAMAMRLQRGLVLIRKPGKLPFSTFSHSYDLEYGQDTLQIHVDALKPSDHVCIVDDVLATGGTAKAAETLCLETGAVVSGFAFLLELEFLKGREKLLAPIQTLFTF